MKFDFGFSMYFLDGPDFSVPEKFFIQVQHKLQIYKKHTQTTVKLYQDEYKERLVEHKKAFQAAMQEADQAYKRHYEEINGTDEDRHSYAMHESGVQEIEYQFTNEEEAIKLNFSEMADHFNKSALVTLYALLETELRRFCGHLQVYFEKRVTLERFEKSDYLKSIIEYLDQIIELETASLQPYLTRIVPLQFLRNRIMHNGGEFPMDDQEFLEDIVKTSDGALSLEDIPDEQLRIVRVRSKYLMPLYHLIGDLFMELFCLLNNKTEYVFLSNRLAYLFRFLAPDVQVIYQAHKVIKNVQVFTFLVESKASEPPFAFQCKFTIAEAAKEEVIVTNQLEQEINNVDRLAIGLTQRSDLIRQTIAGFLHSEKTYTAEFMLYPLL